MSQSLISISFEKAKSQCLRMISKEIEKRTKLGLSIEYDLKDKIQVENLSGYPKNSSEYRYLDVKFKAKILKAQLEELYSNNKFSVRIERYSGGSSIDAYWTGPSISSEELKGIERLYSDSGKTDISVDYFDVDNYCHIGEDTTQYHQRYVNFDSCGFCGGKYEKLAITTEDKKCCMYCVNRREAVSFKVLPKW